MGTRKPEYETENSGLLAMYARQANKNEESWLLDSLEQNNLDDTNFRSREFIFVFDEDVTNRPVAYGRLRVHKEMQEVLEETEADEEAYVRYEWYELTSIYFNPSVNREEAATELFTAMIERLEDELDGEKLFAFVQETKFYEQFGFSPVEESELAEEQQSRFDTKQVSVNQHVAPLQVTPESFTTPEGPGVDEIEAELQEQGFDDDDERTYKYST